MLENVPGIVGYRLFEIVVARLRELGYDPKYDILDVSDFEVPQRRKRLVLVGSLLGDLGVARCKMKPMTVRMTIGQMEDVHETEDPIHRIYPRHTPRIQEKISMIPKNGGNWRDIPEKYWLRCHMKKNVGFNDVYGRLRWDEVSSTITGGCLNPSKGRFLHPEENRCITAREAALLQTFPRDYKFPADIPQGALALQIGNALPPRFCCIQAQNVYVHLCEYCN